MPYVLHMQHKPTLSFRLAESQLKFIRDEAARLGIAVGELLRRIIDEYRTKQPVANVDLLATLEAIRDLHDSSHARRMASDAVAMAKGDGSTNEGDTFDVDRDRSSNPRQAAP